MIGLAETSAAQRPGPRLRGTVHGLGANGSLFPGRDMTRSSDASIITSLDLATGAARQTSLDMALGHAAMSMGDGRILCVAHHRNRSMVLDQEHRIRAQFTSPQGYVYGGHGLILPARNIIVIPMRHARPRTLSDYGRLQIYDLETMRLLDQFETGGLHPHELHTIPGTDELVTTHYGDIDSQRRPFEHNVIDAKLTIFDGSTLKPKRHYPQNDFNAMVTHMRVDSAGWAYFVLTQYIAWPTTEELRDGENAYAVAVSALDRALGRKHDFPVPYQAIEDRQLPIPLPLVRVNTQTGERQVINCGDRHHLRSQSVAYNEVTDQAIALYYHSDNLVVHRPGGAAEVITANELCLTGIRGVTEIPGTSMIAVMGSYRGVTVYDLSSRAVLAHHDTLNYEDTHLYFDSTA